MKMRPAPKPWRSQTGSSLVMVIVLGGIMTITIGGMLSLSSYSLRDAYGRTDWNAAFFHAENALQWAAQWVADAGSSNTLASYSTADGTLSLPPYMATARADTRSGFKNAWAQAVRTNASLPNVYLIKASARVGNKVRTLQTVLIKSPPSETFDYEYFLNNWGWWWGNSMTGNGGNRSNWDFDFRDAPVINGRIAANGDVTADGDILDPLVDTPPFAGQAGQDPVALAHMGTPRLGMPNLKDLSYYETKALARLTQNGIWIGSTQVVMGVHTDPVRPGLYLVGTDAAPIVISNTVVVRGDVVIKGKMTGQGTLYVGGNLYVGGDLTYKNGPDWSTPPETMLPAQRDQWVANNRGKDLVGLVVRGSILAGDVTSASWKTWCYDPPAWGLSTVGDESRLGADGIAHTGDDNIPYLHADGTVSTGYDADGNGLIDGNFDYLRDLTMTSARAAKIARYPRDVMGSPTAYSTLATNYMSQLDAILYTSRAAGMRLAKPGAVFNGALISRNEAIIFNSRCTFNYDSRVHSRYNNDPNRFLDLGLPSAERVRLARFAELPPDRTNL